MRHRKRSKRLGRKDSNRKALLRSLARALIAKESIRTTKRKAKEAQSYIERLITIAKNKSPEAKRQVFAVLRDKGLIKVLFDEISPRFKARSGGYTRIIPLYPRRGDGSPMAILELVEKKAKKAPPKKPKKTEPKKGQKAKIKDQRPEPKEEKREQKVAPATKVDVKEEKRHEKAREEEKKIKKSGFFKNLRKYFRGKAP